MDESLQEKVDSKGKSKLGKIMKEQGYTPHHPVILIPGFGSSALRVENSFHKKWEGERLWINLKKLDFLWARKEKIRPKNDEIRTMETDGSDSDLTETDESGHGEEDEMDMSRGEEEEDRESLNENKMKDLNLNENSQEEHIREKSESDLESDSGKKKKNSESEKNSQQVPIIETSSKKIDQSLNAEGIKEGIKSQLFGDSSEYMKKKSLWVRHVSLSNDGKSDPQGKFKIFTKYKDIFLKKSIIIIIIIKRNQS